MQNDGIEIVRHRVEKGSNVRLVNRRGLVFSVCINKDKTINTYVYRFCSDGWQSWDKNEDMQPIDAIVAAFGK